ncbi:MAG: FecR domain-containing protein [Blautia sp.]|nr:FecR domain-containing protein [Blautia sp.]
MEKALWMKIAAAVVGVAAAAIGVVAFINYQGDDSYRSILIYEVSGDAFIERGDTGTIDAVENLYLESGDRIHVAEDSFMRLKLDDDKYIMVEENSILSIEASGTKKDSETTIRLERGAITNEIQNPLSQKSSYEVTTPNSVMAVRGTVFRVKVYYDEKGEIYTKLSTFEGKVASRLIFPDGTMDEELPVEEGNEVIIYSNEVLTEYLREAEEIVYEDLPLQPLNVLLGLVEEGTTVTGTDKEMLEELIARKQQEDAEGKEEKEIKEKDASELEEDEEKAEDGEEEPEDETDTEDEEGGGKRRQRYGR